MMSKAVLVISNKDSGTTPKSRIKNSKGVAVRNSSLLKSVIKGDNCCLWGKKL